MSGRAVATEYLNDPPLNLDQRKGRYGVAYLRTIAGQAGCTFQEGSPDEDVQAVDAHVGFAAGDVYVQVKTTHQYPLAGASAIGYTAKQGWIDRWSKLVVPVFFVVVVVPDDNGEWLKHTSAGTRMAKTGAYWTQIDADQLSRASSKRIHVPRSQRLDAAALSQWESALMSRFTGGRKP